MRRVRCLVVVLVLGSGCGGRSVRSDSDGDDSGGAATGGSPAGGSLASGGSSTGGSGGISGSSSCAQPFDLFGPECARTALTKHCAKGGCHSRATSAGLLDLTPDELLVARILNVPAKFEFAGPDGAWCRPAGCPPNGAMLLNAFSPSKSWILLKMEPFVPGVTTATLDIGCGDAMPTFNTTGIEDFDGTDKACLTEFFTSVASRGNACEREGDGTALPPPCRDDG